MLQASKLVAELGHFPSTVYALQGLVKGRLHRTLFLAVVYYVL